MMSEDQLMQVALIAAQAAQMAAQMGQGQIRPGAFGTSLKETALAAVTTSQIYGRNSIFDPCSPGDVWGMQVTTEGLLPWIGFRPNRFWKRRVDFISWWGPEGTGAGSAGTLATGTCDDPDGWEYGDCGYDLCHTAWYAIAGDTLDPFSIVQERCETSPRFRLNGVQIRDDLEWQLNGMLNVLNQAIEYGAVHGSHANANESDGLESIIKTGYLDKNNQPCHIVDSIIVDWNCDDLDGAVNGFGNFFDYLDEVINEIEYKAQNRGPISERDMVLLTSRFMATCLLDSFACYTTCGVTTASDITDQALRAQQRAERRALNGGPLFDGTRAVGFIHLKSGRRLPIIVSDYITITQSGDNYCADIYLLTRRIGNTDVLYGEYLDMRQAVNRALRAAPGLKWRSDVGGRLLQSHKTDNFCLSLIAGSSPEYYLAAPWAQARFIEVGCARERKPQVGDPFQPDFHTTQGALYPSQRYPVDCG
jgi:hypothetical protein